MRHESFNSSSRKTHSPALWIVLTFVAGCVAIALYVVSVSGPEIRDRITLRRAWLNQNLGHYDVAIKDLLSIKKRLMWDWVWQDQMLQALMKKRDDKLLYETAMELEASGIRLIDWRWNGWLSAVRQGQEAIAVKMSKPLHQPDVFSRLSRENREFFTAYEKWAPEFFKWPVNDAALGAAATALGKLHYQKFQEDLIGCLLAEIDLLYGNWQMAQTNLLRINPKKAPNRSALDEALYLLSQGHTSPALGAMDYYYSAVGAIDPQWEELTNRIAQKMNNPSQANETIALWRRIRATVNDMSVVAPDFKAAAYPALPAGEIAASIPPIPVADDQGKVEAILSPLPPKALNAQLELPRGSYAIVVRGAANRFEGLGATFGIHIDSRIKAYTYFPSRTPVQRVFFVKLKEGATVLKIIGPPLLKKEPKGELKGAKADQDENSPQSLFWLDKVIVYRLKEELKDTDSGEGDFMFLPKQ